MSVEKMMNRLRSFSQGKKELKEENQSIRTGPSKEDIISAIDGFGNRIEGKMYSLLNEPHHEKTCLRDL